ncbi:MAG: RecX family transcriptional regulator [Bacteroidales bacterium]|nr:RecX family transcriptional regulator [Bacteroidales bacterium]
MTRDQVLSRLQNLCARSEHCAADVYRKALKALEGDAEAAAAVRDALLADGYVDDLRYATAFARDKAALTGWGPVKIRFALRAKGLPEETVAAALAALEPERAEEKLRRLVEAKARSLEGDPQRRLKLLKFALGRGYDYDSVEKIIRESGF